MRMQAVPHLVLLLPASSIAAETRRLHFRSLSTLMYNADSVKRASL